MTERLSQDQALELLAANDEHRIGGWTVAETDRYTNVWFRVSIPADAPPADLQSAILAAEAADLMEIEIIGVDRN